MEGKVNIKVKHMSEKPIDLEVTMGMSVKEVKEVLSSLISVPAGDQKLICKGKILKDEDRVSDVMEEGCTIHAVGKFLPDQKQSSYWQHIYWNHCWRNCRVRIGCSSWKHKCC